MRADDFSESLTEDGFSLTRSKKSFARSALSYRSSFTCWELLADECVGWSRT